MNCIAHINNKNTQTALNMKHIEFGRVQSTNLYKLLGACPSIGIPWLEVL